MLGSIYTALAQATKPIPTPSLERTQRASKMAEGKSSDNNSPETDVFYAEQDGRWCTIRVPTKDQISNLAGVPNTFRIEYTKAQETTNSDAVNLTQDAKNIELLAKTIGGSPNLLYALVANMFRLDECIKVDGYSYLKLKKECREMEQGKIHAEAQMDRAEAKAEEAEARAAAAEAKAAEAAGSSEGDGSAKDEQIASLQAELAQVQENLDVVYQERTEQQASSQEARRIVQTQNQEKLDRMQRQYADELEAMNLTIKDLQAQLQAAKAEAEAAEKREKDLQTALDAALQAATTGDAAQAEAEAAKAAAEAAAQAEAAKAKAAAAEAQEKTAAAEAARAEAEERASILQVNLEKAKQAIEAYARQQDELQTQNNELQTRNNELQQEIVLRDEGETIATNIVMQSLNAAPAPTPAAASGGGGGR